MQNSFIRLKHYRPDKVDARENHATECLAACLRWSVALRAEFVRFLFPKIIPPELQQTDSIQIQTQESFADGFLDLVLRCEGFIVVVEVKVFGNPEDEGQLTKYLNWLAGKNGVLFSLVQSPNRLIDGFLAKKRIERRTWEQFYYHLKQIGSSKEKDVSESEVYNLRNEFCQYLEQEGIVSVYTIQQLTKYSDGVFATNALESIFDRIKEEIEERDINFRTKIKGLSDVDNWPRLEIMHPQYQRVFGGGDLHRIWVWFAWPEKWDAKAYNFIIELQLWSKYFKSDWTKTYPKLQEWKSKLEKCGREFDFWADDTSYTNKVFQFSSEPARIYCYFRDIDQPAIAQRFSSIDEIVQWLSREVLDIHKLVLSL